MRMASSTGDTKIFPSPILPVLADLTMASMAAYTRLSGSTISSLILGRKSAVDFGVALLTSEPLDFAHGHPFDAHVAQGVFDFFQLERLDDGFDFFHIN